MDALADHHEVLGRLDFRDVGAGRVLADPVATPASPGIAGHCGVSSQIGSGPNTEEIISDRIISFSDRTFSANVVDEIIRPTVDNVVGQRSCRADLARLLAVPVGGIVGDGELCRLDRDAHGQHNVRHPVTQRLFALWLYIVFPGARGADPAAGRPRTHLCARRHPRLVASGEHRGHRVRLFPGRRAAPDRRA